MVSYFLLIREEPFEGLLNQSPAEHPLKPVRMR